MLFRICRQAQNIAGAVFVLRACTVSTEILTTWIPTLSYGFLTFFGAHMDTFREETTGNRLTGYGMVWEDDMLIRQQKATGRIFSNKSIEFFI